MTDEHAIRQALFEARHTPQEFIARRRIACDWYEECHDGFSEGSDPSIGGGRVQ